MVGLVVLMMLILINDSDTNVHSSFLRYCLVLASRSIHGRKDGTDEDEKDKVTFLPTPTLIVSERNSR